jgi:hypothetical protein
MAVSREKLMYLGGTMLAFGTGIASTVGQELVGSGLQNLDSGLLLSAGLTTGGGVAVNLLSNTVQNLCTAFNKKVIRTHPNDLNHDLQKTLLTAVDRALVNTLVLYGDTKPGKADMDAAESFIAAIRPVLKSLFKAPEVRNGYDAHVRKYIHAPIDEANAEIHQKLRQELEGAALPAGFASIFSDVFAGQLRLCFSEELKDKNNNGSWVAFQKMMLEAAKSDLESLLAGQTRIEDALKDVREEQLNSKLHRLKPGGARAVAKLLKEINQPARIQLQLDKALDDLLGEIRRELSQVKLLVEATHEEVVDFRKTYEKDRVDWWSSKMVVAYGMVVILAAAMTMTYHYFSGQPFMVTLQVHGPGGTTDMVLEGKVTAMMAPGGHSQEETLDEKGRAFFRQIPGKYKGDSVMITLSGLEGEPYRPRAGRFCLEKDAILYLPLTAVGLDKIQGIVVDEKSRPLAEAIVIVQNEEVRTDANGLFTIMLPAEKQKRLQDISIVKSGYRQETIHKVAPHVQTKPLEIMLFKE